MTNLLVYSIVALAALVFVAVVVPLAGFNFDNGEDLNDSINKTDLTDDKINELLDAFENCDVVQETFKKDEYIIKAKIVSRIGNKCNTNFELINAPGLGAFAIGSRADCRLSKEEIESLMINFSFEGLDCNGQLFELAKTYIN